MVHRRQRLRVLAGHLTAASSPWGRYVQDRLTTLGAPPPFAANGGAPFIDFSADGDSGVRAASAAYLQQHKEGKAQAVAKAIQEAPEGPIKTEWGVGYRTYQECLFAIREKNEPVPDGAVALPLHYTVCELPSYSHVPSNSLWKQKGPCWEIWSDAYNNQRPKRPRIVSVADGKMEDEDEIIEQHEQLYFPQVLRDGRRIGEYYPGLNPYTGECMDKLGVCLVEHPNTACKDFYNAAEVESVFYKECEQILLKLWPDATDAWVYDHNVFNKDAPRKENQEAKDPGVAGGYANNVHNDLTDNSGPVRCRELLTKNLRCFSEHRKPLTDAEADAKMSKRFMSINMARPIETIEQNPFVLCAWPSFRDQPYITNYRIYDDRVGETQRFTYRPTHEWYWFPKQRPEEISLLKCYDSCTDGETSRWSFHTSCIDPTAPPDAPCRKSVVVRSYVFF